jgi:hypothetical protein
MSATSGASQYLENALSNWFRGTTFPAVPANLYLALFTTAPANGVTAGSVEVPSSNNYSRLAIVPNGTNFGAPSGAAPNTMASGANFVMATPSGSWGTVVGWALFDASSAGNMLLYGTFTGVAVGNGDTVEFLTGNLTVTVS